MAQSSITLPPHFAHWIVTSSVLTVSPYSTIPMSEEIRRMYPSGYFGGSKTTRKIHMPPLSEVRKYWPGRLEPEPEDELFSATGTRMNRRGWLTEFSREDWLSVKPDLEIRGKPDSPLIRMLIHDPDYRRMYVEYLIMKHEKPTSLLLEELKRQGHRSIANEIMERVVIDSEDF